ncbi:MAG: hypothetical protein WBN68_23090 [Sedimenticolaceae bacterium]
MKITMSIVAAAAVLGTLIAQPVFADANVETFTKLDVDGNGFISMEEAEAHSELPDAFADGDDNDDGQLEMAEFAKLEISDE